MEQYKSDKENSEKNIKSILSEMNEKNLKEKALIINSVENELKSLTEMVFYFFLFYSIKVQTKLELLNFKRIKILKKNYSSKII
jgi:hypothetical protein